MSIESFDDQNWKTLVEEFKKKVESNNRELGMNSLYLSDPEDSSHQTEEKQIERGEVIKNLAGAIYRDLEYKSSIKLEAGQYDEAIKTFTEAIEIAPKFSAAYAWRGEVYRQSGNSDQAIQDFEKALALDPNFDWVKEKLKEIHNV